MASTRACLAVVVSRARITSDSDSACLARSASLTNLSYRPACLSHRRLWKPVQFLSYPASERSMPMSSTVTSTPPARPGCAAGGLSRARGLAVLDELDPRIDALELTAVRARIDDVLEAQERLGRLDGYSALFQQQPGRAALDVPVQQPGQWQCRLLRIDAHEAPPSRDGVRQLEEGVRDQARHNIPMLHSGASTTVKIVPNVGMSLN